MYEIDFSVTAEKQLCKLETEVQSRIVAVLERIRVRPYPFITRLVGTAYYRLRVGEYRVILDVREQKVIIFVIEVGHRRNVYE